MKINKILSLAFATALLFATSCRSSNDSPEDNGGSFGSGYLISNEGLFNTPTAELSWTNGDFSSVKNDLYKSNNGEALGDVLQDVVFNGNYAFLVLNNTQKVKVIDRYSYKKVGEIASNLAFPRHATLSGSSLYVTTTNSVSVFDANTLNFVKKIDLGKTADYIVSVGNFVYVQNASFGTGKDISIIDSRNNSVKSTVTVPNGDIQKIITDGSNVYALASDYTSADSFIYQISSSGNIEKTTTLTNIPTAMNLCIDNGNLYFTSGLKIYSMATNSSVVPTTPILTATQSQLYSGLYGFNVIDGKIFTSDAQGFTQPSKVTVYNLSGAVVKTFDTGIATNGFYKN